MIFYFKDNKKKKGITLISLIICLAVSSIIIACSLDLLSSLFIRMKESVNSEHRIYKLYNIMITVENFMEEDGVILDNVKNGRIDYTCKGKESSLFIDSNGIFCFENKGSYEKFNSPDSMIDEYMEPLVVSQKGNLLYITFKMKKGESLKCCVAINKEKK